MCLHVRQYADNPELRECVNALSARDAILEPGIGKTFEQSVMYYCIGIYVNVYAEKNYIVQCLQSVAKSMLAI